MEDTKTRLRSPLLLVGSLLWLSQTIVATNQHSFNLTLNNFEIDSLTLEKELIPVRGRHCPSQDVNNQINRSIFLPHQLRVFG